MKVGVPRVSADCIAKRTEKMLEDPEIRRSLLNFKEFATVDDSGMPDLRKYCQATSAFLELIYSTKAPLTLSRRLD